MSNCLEHEVCCRQPVIDMGGVDENWPYLSLLEGPFWQAIFGTFWQILIYMFFRVEQWWKAAAFGSIARAVPQDWQVVIFCTWKQGGLAEGGCEWAHSRGVPGCMGTYSSQGEYTSSVLVEFLHIYTPVTASSTTTHLHSFLHNHAPHSFLHNHTLSHSQLLS